MKTVQSENSLMSRCSFISERRTSFNDHEITSFILGESTEILSWN